MLGPAHKETHAPPFLALAAAFPLCLSQLLRQSRDSLATRMNLLVMAQGSSGKLREAVWVGGGNGVRSTTAVSHRCASWSKHPATARGVLVTGRKERSGRGRNDAKGDIERDCARSALGGGGEDRCMWPKKSRREPKWYAASTESTCSGGVSHWGQQWQQQRCTVCVCACRVAVGETVILLTLPLHAY